MPGQGIGTKTDEHGEVCETRILNEVGHGFLKKDNPYKLGDSRSESMSHRKA